MARQTLGTNVLPSHYSVVFEPDFRTFKFKGKAIITLQVKRPTRIVKVHAKELRISHAEAKGLEARIHQEGDEITFTFLASLKGKVQLTIEFSGNHNDGMYGFYRSKYSQNGKDAYLLTTQFEAANARAAFPCFDEPAMKATFDVALIIDKDLTAISNMPVKSEKSFSPQKKQVTFQTTPRMSTYLLYLAVGNFKSLSTKYRNVQIRVLTIPDKIQYAALALDYTTTFLKFFDTYFQIPYPLPKLDIIAIPDFASGAMENWGAITFREIALLGDENTSVAVKQQIAITIAHELAHQWFGNLVTMEWWEDLWLNESFATFMSYKAVHAAYPEWELPLQYFEDTIEDALHADQLEATHPISVTINSVVEVEEIFDRISYDKGGSILHMLEEYVGEEIFRKGLTAYLKKHAYHNATKQDLWKAIEQAYGKNTLIPMMQGWIIKPGYPLVQVTSVTGGFQLEQRRFTLRGKVKEGQWLIPLQYQTATGNTAQLLLKGKNILIKEPSDWIKINVGQHGFYRAGYDRKILLKLGAAIRDKQISWLDAAGIEQDFFAQTMAGQGNVKEYLQFIEQYCLEAHYPLDSGISAHLNGLYRLFYGKKLAAAVAKTSVLFHQKLLKRLGWDRKKEERNTTTLLRSMAIGSLGLLNDRPTLKKALGLFLQIKDKKVPIDPNLRGVIYSLAAWQGNEQTFSYLLERYKQEQLPEESRKLLRALGMFRDISLLKKALDLSQSSTVRLQDSLVLPLTVAGNFFGGELIWPWTKEHWKLLMKKYSGGTHMLPYVLGNLAVIDTEEGKKEIEQFFAAAENFRDDLKLTYRQTLERIDISLALLKKNR